MGSEDPGEGRKKLDPFVVGLPDDLDAMEDAVHKAIEEGTDDPVLAALIEIARLDTTPNRPDVRTIMEEPIFYRRFFKKWVQGAIGEQKAMDQALREALDLVKTGQF